MIRSEAIEALASDILEKYYFEKTSLKETIDELKSFKSSKNQEKQELLSCVLLNIIDEARFFAHFPEKELDLTGDLFVHLI